MTENELYKDVEALWLRWVNEFPHGRTMSEREFELWVALGTILGKEIMG